MPYADFFIEIRKSDDDVPDDYGDHQRDDDSFADEKYVESQDKADKAKGKSMNIHIYFFS